MVNYITKSVKLNFQGMRAAQIRRPMLHTRRAMGQIHRGQFAVPR